MKLDRIIASVAAANTFKAVAEEWYAKAEKEGSPLPRSPKSAGCWALHMRLSATARLLTSSRTNCSHYCASLKRGESMSPPSAFAAPADRFRYAIATARANRDISADLRGALISVKVTHRAAITTPTEVGALLRVIDGYEGHSVTRTALKLMPHVFVCPGDHRRD